MRSTLRLVKVLLLCAPRVVNGGGLIPDSTLGLTEIAYAPDFRRALASNTPHSEGPLGTCDRGKGADKCLGPSFYIGSPSIVRSPSSGALLASADLFDHGPSADCWPNFFVAHRSPGWIWQRNATLFVSANNGTSWDFRGFVLKHYWSTLFAHGGRVYLMGVSDDKHGAVKISQTENDGKSWTQQNLFSDARYTTGPTAVLFAAGKIFRAYERVDKTGRSSVMVSASAAPNAQLLDRAKWSITKPLLFKKAWIPHSWGPVVQPTQPWVEGNAVQGPDGEVYNLLRLESGWSKTRPVANKAILLRAPNATAAQEFVSIVDMPGGSCKFTVRRDSGGSGRYIALTNNVSNVSACPSARNVLVLCSSPDLRVRVQLIGHL